MTFPASRWRRLGITWKTAASFSLLAVLLALEGGMNFFMLGAMRRAESEMVRSMDIRQRIFEMDGELEKARRLHRDFFLTYPEIGFSNARNLYFTPSQRVIGHVMNLSEELGKLIGSVSRSSPLGASLPDINLYLSSAQRFSFTFQELVEMVNALADPDGGLQRQLEERKEQLKAFAARRIESMLIFDRIEENEESYWRNRQRSDLQAAMNESFELEGYLSSLQTIDREEKARIHGLLKEYQRIANQIAELDMGIRGKFNDFALQASAVDPISAKLKALAEHEVVTAKERIDKANILSVLILLAMAGTGFAAVLVVGYGMHFFVTRRVTGLTRAAEELRRGNFGQRIACRESGDEIDTLAGTLNEMAARMQDLVGNLERNVTDRTAELSRARDELEEAVRGLDEKNHMLEILSRTDRLTGIANRHRLEEALQAEILRARRYGAPFCVIMLDIDHFKRVNDTFGHQIGDSVLVRVAGKLASSARETDVVGRWGGEEFLLICPETTLAVGLEIAERMRRDFEADTVPGVGGVTSSFGVASFRQNDDMGEILERVDRAMYRAKKHGRNRVRSETAGPQETEAFE